MSIIPLVLTLPWFSHNISRSPCIQILFLCANLLLSRLSMTGLNAYNPMLTEETDDINGNSIDGYHFSRFQIHFASFKVIISKEEFVHGPVGTESLSLQFHLKERSFHYKTGTYRSISKTLHAVLVIDIVALFHQYSAMLSLNLCASNIWQMPFAVYLLRTQHQTVKKAR